MISILFKQNQVFLYMVYWFKLVQTELNHIEPVQYGSVRFSSGSNLIDLVLVLVQAIDPPNRTELNFGNTTSDALLHTVVLSLECNKSEHYVASVATYT
jgi:hypothetical protein